MTAPQSDISLQGRVAIITGAAGGLGRSMVAALRAAGAAIAAVDVDAALGRDDPVLRPDDILKLGADVSDEAACRDAVANTIARFGSLDILVNCAGITGEQPSHGPFPRFWERESADWRRVQAINHNGAFHMAYHAVRPMIEQGRGRIVNISTSFATMVMAGMAAYGPSKAAMEASAAIWAKELAGTGVTVNVLLPGGPVATPFVPASMASNALLAPDVMIAPLLWLASDASGGITGKRFIARDWDRDCPGEAAAAAIAAPAGWGG